jgi:hypothetical protein
MECICSYIFNNILQAIRIIAQNRQQVCDENGCSDDSKLFQFKTNFLVNNLMGVTPTTIPTTAESPFPLKFALMILMVILFVGMNSLGRNMRNRLDEKPKANGYSHKNAEPSY